MSIMPSATQLIKMSVIPLLLFPPAVGGVPWRRSPRDVRSDAFGRLAIYWGFKTQRAPSGAAARALACRDGKASREHLANRRPPEVRVAGVVERLERGAPAEHVAQILHALPRRKGGARLRRD